MASHLLDALHNAKLKAQLQNLPASNDAIKVLILRQIEKVLINTEPAQKLIVQAYLKKAIPAPSAGNVMTCLLELNAICTSSQPAKPISNHAQSASSPTPARTTTVHEVIELELDDDSNSAIPVASTSHSSSASMELSSAPSSTPSSSSSSTTSITTSAKPQKSVVDLLMGPVGKRHASTELFSPIPTKKPKMASSTASKYVPNQSFSFLQKNAPTTFASASHAPSAPVYASKPQTPASFLAAAPQRPQAFSGYDDLGLPANSSSPAIPPASSRTSSASFSNALPPHSMPKTLMPQRSIGVHGTNNGALASSPFATGDRQGNYVVGPASNSRSTRLPANNVIPVPIRKPDFSDYVAAPMGPHTSSSKVGESMKASSSATPASRQLPSSFGTKQTGAAGKSRLKSNVSEFPRKNIQPKGGLNPGLSAGQREIVEKALSGESFFFTGAAGTGKSFVLKEIIRLMEEEYETRDAVAITAPTGIAAIELGGWTIHSFAGIGIGEEAAKMLANRVKRNPQAADRWRKVCVLIVDEISMVSAELFDKLSFVANEVRGATHGPFGGIQLILSGDFFQLPPIVKQTSAQQQILQAATLAAPSLYAFQASTWKTSIKHTFVLNQVFRQQGDLAFVKMLNEIRLGEISDATYKKLLTRVKNSNPQNSSKEALEPTLLFPRRHEVEEHNLKRLATIRDKDIEYQAIDVAQGGEAAFATFKASCMAPGLLKLRKGAQVILIRNMKDLGLVNGSRGTVVGFEEETPDGRPPNPKVVFHGSNPSIPIPIKSETWKWERGEVILAERQQIPLILGWALSIHKCQGMTLTSTEISLRSVFTEGQAYVALSRVTTFDGLVISQPFDKKVFRTNPDVVKFYQSLSEV